MSCRFFALSNLLLLLSLPITLQAQSFVFGPANVVSGCDGGCPGGREITLPSENNGVVVNAIADSAFEAYELDSVVIPDSIQFIGARAFLDCGLTTLQIGQGVTEIGEKAFSSNRLTDIDIPNSATVIKSEAFSRNKLTAVVVPPGTRVIYTRVYEYNQLEAVSIPPSVVEIRGLSFYYNKLTSVLLPSSLEKIGPWAFRYNQIASLQIPSKAINIGRAAFEGNRLESVNIPEGISKIESSVFAFNKLSSINLPDSITEIGVGAFRNNALVSIDIPDSVVTIGSYAFANNELTLIRIPKKLTDIAHGVFSNNQISAIDFQGAVKSIGIAAFSYNSLDTISIPSHIEHIGNSAFYKNQLVSLSLADGLKDIGSDAFEGNKIESLVIPSTVRSIGSSAFSDNMITTITIPEGVETIGRSAFYNNLLSTLVIPEGLSSLGVAAFGKNKLESIVFPADMDQIPDELFIKNSFASLVIPKTIERIGARAFHFNVLQELTLSEGLKSIDRYAFAGNQLTSVVIPNTVDSIGSSAFLGNLISSLTLPESISYISAFSFKDNKLSELMIPARVNFIGWQAFSENQIRSLVVPVSVTEVDFQAFAFNQIESILFEGGRPELEVTAFDENSPLQKVLFKPGRTGWPGAKISGVMPTPLGGSKPPSAPDPAPDKLDFKISTHSDSMFDNMPLKLVVHDVNIYAAGNVEKADIQHVAHVLAQLLDSDGDGEADEPSVRRSMKQTNSTLVIWDNQQNWEHLVALIPDNMQLSGLEARKINREWEPGLGGRFDGALEFALKHVAAAYASTYPNVFGAEPGSRLANAMDTARGGYFEVVPASYPDGAWFVSRDNDCNYRCMVLDYFYWALSTKLGAHIDRGAEINGKWKLNTSGELQSVDTEINKLITEEAFNLPQVLPDGNYQIDESDNPRVDLGRLSGTWYAPSETGHGIMLQVFDGGSSSAGVTMTWFTFDESGNQQWFYGDSQQLVASRNNSGSCYGGAGNYFATFPTLSRKGGEFVNSYDPTEIQTSPWGTLSVCYDTSKDEVTLKYLRSNNEAKYSMLRLTQTSKARGTRNDTLAGLTGTWYNPSKSGQGLYLEMIERTEGKVGVNLAWYGFKHQKPMYFLVIIEEVPESGGSMTIPIYETSGAKFGEEFSSADVRRDSWGELHVERVNCNKIKLRFEGVDEDVEESLSRLSAVSGRACH